MADWKGVRKGEYEAGGREDRKESSKVHRNVRSRSSTLGSDSELKHSAHTKRKKRESSRSRFKRKRRRSSSSLSDDMEDERQARVRPKEWKKVKRDCNSSESSDECTRGHVTSTIRSERSSERLKRKHKKRKRKCSSPSSDSSSDSDSSASYSSDSSDRQKRRKKHSKREKHSHRLHKKRKKHKLKSKRKKSSKTDSGRVVSYAAAGIEGPHPLPVNPKQQDPSAIQSVVPISGINVKMRGPMTKEEWEKRQSVVRRVYDPDTGRHRLVKGDGEIIEEIVSREQQKAINKQATLGDGLSFRAGLSRLL